MPKKYTRRSPSQWQQIVSDQSLSGLSQQHYCQSNDIAYGTFQTWRKRLADQPAAPDSGFVELPRTVTSSSQALPLDPGLRVRLELGAGVVLELLRD